MTPKHTCGPHYGTRGQRAYQFRLEGLTWKVIASNLATESESLAVNLAKRHAQRHNLAWPIHVPRPRRPAAPPSPRFQDAARKRQEAYALRQAGCRWKEVAEGRFSAVSHAVEAARLHAQATGKPWPIRVA